MPSEIVHSPNGTKAVELDYEGEVRFGPAYFRAKPVGFSWSLSNPIVGEDVYWSADSRYVVFIQFLSVNSGRTPDVRLLAIDTLASSGPPIEIDHNTQGLIWPNEFAADGALPYRHVASGVSVDRVWHPPA